VAGQVLARERPLHGAHRAGEEAEAVDDGGDLVAQDQIARLAAIERLEGREGFRLRLDPVGELQEQGRALGRGGARPRGEGPVGGGDRRVDLVGGGFGQLHHRVAGARIENGLRFLRSGLEAPADQHLGLGGLGEGSCVHGVSPLISH
jgi:hypothetical protein